MHNSKYQCHMAVCCTYHQPTYFSKLLNRSHTKKAYLLTKNTGRIFWKKFSRMNQQAEKKDDRKSTRTRQKNEREEIVKWNQMTALRFQTRGRHRNPRPPFGRTGSSSMLKSDITAEERLIQLRDI